MKINFDETKNTVLESLGMTQERFTELKTLYVTEGTSINSIMKGVLEDESPELNMNEKIGLVFEIGANFGQNVMARELQKNAEEAMLKASVAVNGGKMDD